MRTTHKETAKQISQCATSYGAKLEAKLEVLVANAGVKDGPTPIFCNLQELGGSLPHRPSRPVTIARDNESEPDHIHQTSPSTTK